MERRLKTRILAWEQSANPFLRGLARLLRSLGHVRRFLLNPRIRSEQITRVLHAGSHIQGATYSESDRYPALFAACRNQLAGIPAPAILCFGCATGEEAFSLADYLPHATILGVDLNRWCLRQAQRNNHNPRVRFLHATSREFASQGPFDAIFAMAVFQRSENRNHPGPVAHASFSFVQFEREIGRLDARLKPGGIFFIDHADFRFEDTAAAARYTPLQFPGVQFVHQRPLFGPDNRLIAAEYTMQRAFQKKRDGEAS